METVEQLTEKAVCLKLDERLKLVEAVFSSRDQPDKEIEQRWIDADANSALASYPLP